MENMIFDLDAFFERIHYKDGAQTSEVALRNLHVAFTLNVPFENLDVFYRRPVLLDGGSLFNKIVKERRGGYCFEMNGIFSLALQAMGFKVTNLLAKVAVGGTQYTTKTHQAILVEAGGRQWLADVGFGNDGIMAPLLLEENTEQKQFAHTYRLVAHATLGYVLEKKNQDGFFPLYAFTLEPCSPEDFLMSNHFTATFPGSFFLTMRMCTMPKKDGRITLTDSHFKVVRGDAVSTAPIANEGEFAALLKEHFNLDLDRIKTGNEYHQ
ncbi:MAG: arylamine N-acetyltransferase [Acidobacteriota bacterium]|nr:arylamine N-acetyltransferase [Acidobacteriota bacterium]